MTHHNPQANPLLATAAADDDDRYTANANVMNQPLSDEGGEKLRLAQRMVDDYLSGRVPPPPPLEAPAPSK